MVKTTEETNLLCEECQHGEAVLKCNECEMNLCEDCADDYHLCFVKAIDELKDRLYTPLEDMEGEE